MIGTLRKNLRHIGALAMIPAFAGLVKLYENYSDRVAPQPKPLQFRDVNGDGIEDKIIQVRVAVPFGFTAIRTPELTEMVLYGVEVNGKKVYLPKGLYDNIMYATKSS